MIEATCSACGTLNRIVETEIPQGAKFVNCASCKSRVAIPTNTAMGGSPMKSPAAPPMLPPMAGKAPPPVPGSRASGPTIDLADLPAPKRSSALGGPTGVEPSRPAPRSGLAAALDANDLPAPKPRGQSSSIDVELPAAKPRGAQSSTLDLDDLLAPTARPAAGGGRAGIIDLPAPKGAQAAGPSEIVDLPAPKRSGGVTDLPMSKGGISDLPTPKGGAARPAASKSSATDLLTPRGPKPTGSPDLPAPKGFFDDLPQSAGAAANARPDLPAPKGFFDDLPGRPNAPSTQNVAPKGFFDDLPANKSGAGGASPGNEIAPKGFFDDLPGRPNDPSTQNVAPKGFFDDLPANKTGSQAIVPARNQSGTLEPMDLAGSQELDLAPGHYGDDLDLSKPSSTTGAAAQRYETPARQMQPLDREPLPPVIGQQRGPEMALELEEPRIHTPKLGPKRSDKSVVGETDARHRSRRIKLIGGIAAGVLLLGGGGFMLYHRHADSAQRKDQIEEQLGKARGSLVAIDSGHWQRATAAAKQVLELDATNSDALGVAAEASLAGAYDDGSNAVARTAQGRKFVTDALAAGVTGPALERAQALQALAMNQPERAIAKLEPMLKRAQGTNDANLALYLGWAQSAKGDQPAAIKSFDTAMTMNPAVKVPALYARGRAKLAMTDLEGARSDFTAILAQAKDHIGAQVGLAAALPASKAAQQEADLLAILQRKDIATADPRAVVRAWVLAGDDATRAGRYDAARDRYHKALAIDASGIAAQTGLADVELRDGKLDTASELILKTLTLAPDDVRAQLVVSQISIRQGKLDDAAARLKALAGRAALLSPVEQAQLQLVTGKLLETKGQDDAAIDAYIAGAKIVGDLDLGATIAAVNKLSKMAQQATDAKDPKRAEALHARADQLLGEREEHAKDDPELSLTLGVAYLESDNAAKAEPWLRRTADARPNDPEAQFQLAKDYLKQGKVDDALELLKKAIDLDPTRTEIGLELARAYEAALRDDDAGPLYIKLLDSKEPSLELRSRAGRFFARTGQMGKAADQGREILKVDRANAAGMFLRGEGLLDRGQFEDARKAFQLAVQTDRDPQYLDGLGRAAAAEAEATSDTKFNQLALQSFQEASKLAPKMFNPLKAQGMLLFKRHESLKATEPLKLAWEIKHDDEVARLMGSALQDLNNNAKATEWLQVANDLKPTAETSRRLGELYRDANKGPLAEKEYSRAVSLAEAQEKATGKPLDWLTDTYYQLGKLRMDLGNKPGAKEAWTRFINRVPPPPPSARTTMVKQKLATDLR